MHASPSKPLPRLLSRDGGAHARRREPLPHLLSRGGGAHAFRRAVRALCALSPPPAGRHYAYKTMSSSPDQLPVSSTMCSRSSLIQRAETMNTARKTGLGFSWSQALSPLGGHTRGQRRRGQALEGTPWHSRRLPWAGRPGTGLSSSHEDLPLQCSLLPPLGSQHYGSSSPTQEASTPCYSSTTHQGKDTLSQESTRFWVRTQITPVALMNSRRRFPRCAWCFQKPSGSQKLRCFLVFVMKLTDRYTDRVGVLKKAPQLENALSCHKRRSRRL
jgi:hypothetical protein